MQSPVASTADHQVRRVQDVLGAEQWAERQQGRQIGLGHPGEGGQVTGWVWRYPHLALGTLADAVSRSGFWLCEIYLVALTVTGQPLVPAVMTACYILRQAATARKLARRHALPRWHIAAQVAIDLVLRNLDLVGLLTMRRQTWLTPRRPTRRGG
ncbi:hypothetical protein [Streptomyces sp. NPDC001678]|uniref:hypothetical protein n=1 Tax=Streptomyces sp. NPDC001678 TaxID=3364599 RepID=UPI0036B80EE4